MSDRAADRALVAMIVGESVTLVVMGLLRWFGLCEPGRRFALSVLAALFALGAMALWARRSAVADQRLAAILVFGGFAVAEVLVFATAFLPDGARCLAVTPFAVAQLLCRARFDRALRAHGPDEGDLPAARLDDYYSFAHAGVADKRFLAASAVGIAAIALVIGFLRGFPDGEPIPFAPATRTACFVVTEALYLAFLFAVLRQRTRAMTVGVWVVMELLAALTLVLYCAFPGRLDVGAVAVTSLSSLMGAFTLYVIVAFMMAGTREPVTYAITVWGLWVGFRALGRFVLLPLLPVGADSHLAGTIVSLILLVSTQLVFSKLIDVARFAAREEALSLASGDAGQGGRPEAAPGGQGDRLAAVPVAAGSAADSRSERALERFLGLESSSSLDDVRLAAMRRSAEAMGRQFLLSNREVEVLTLYALGHTQKSLAEELCVSQTTVRTHIKRIYAKCDMHSRQELLDYLRTYAE